MRQHFDRLVFGTNTTLIKKIAKDKYSNLMYCAIYDKGKYFYKIVTSLFSKVT